MGAGKSVRTMLREVNKMTIEEMKKAVNLPINERERYVLRLGRFGMYIYDSKDKKDVDLQQTIDIMNKFEQSENLSESRKIERDFYEALIDQILIILVMKGQPRSQVVKYVDELSIKVSILEDKCSQLTTEINTLKNPPKQPFV